MKLVYYVSLNSAFATSLFVLYAAAADELSSSPYCCSNNKAKEVLTMCVVLFIPLSIQRRELVKGN